MKTKKEKHFRFSPDTGNRTTLTEELIDQIEDLFSKGLSRSIIAGYLGINPQLLREWLVKGAAYGRGIHGDLFLRCAKAQGQFEHDLLSELNKCALGAPAEYLMTKRGKLRFDKKGHPIVVKEEIKPNPKWMCWLLENRFSTNNNQQSDIFSGQSNGALLNEESGHFEEKKDCSKLSEKEQLEELEKELNVLRAKLDVSI